MNSNTLLISRPHIHHPPPISHRLHPLGFPSNPRFPAQFFQPRCTLSTGGQLYLQLPLSPMYVRSKDVISRCVPRNLSDNFESEDGPNQDVNMGANILDILSRSNSILPHVTLATTILALVYPPSFTWFTSRCWSTVCCYCWQWLKLFILFSVLLDLTIAVDFLMRHSRFDSYRVLVPIGYCKILIRCKCLIRSKYDEGSSEPPPIPAMVNGPVTRAQAKRLQEELGNFIVHYMAKELGQDPEGPLTWSRVEVGVVEEVASVGSCASAHERAL